MLKVERIPAAPARWRLAALIVLAAALGILARRILLPVMQIAAGGAVLAFLLTPVARLYERRLPPGAAALLALASGAAAAAAFVWLLVPPLSRQVYELAAGIPAALQVLRALLERAGDSLRAHGLPLAAPPEFDPSLITARLPGLMRGTLSAANSFAGSVSRFSLMAVLCYFFLRDRDKLFLRLELAVPQAWRRLAVRTGSAIQRELRLYLRAQATIALLVGLLTSLALMLAGVRSALLLGLLVGAFNMIPYLGPLIGAVPVLIMALGQGPLTVLWAALALIVVQQLDGSFISPRIMGSLTGISPAVVLLAVFLGGQAAGILGMLFALPLLMVLRTCVRMYVRRGETAA